MDKFETFLRKATKFQLCLVAKKRRRIQLCLSKLWKNIHFDKLTFDIFFLKQELFNSNNKGDHMV